MKFQKNTIYLIDANVIVRLLVEDKSSSAFQKAYQFFELISKKEIKGVITEGILMEVYYVLTKVYNFDKLVVIDKLKKILNFSNIINNNKITLFETLNILEKHNIDFMDAFLCAKAKNENLEIFSFDKDIEKCMK